MSIPIWLIVSFIIYVTIALLPKFLEALPEVIELIISILVFIWPALKVILILLVIIIGFYFISNSNFLISKPRDYYSEEILNNHNNQEIIRLNRAFTPEELQENNEK